jgi:hypothetical protein
MNGPGFFHHLNFRHAASKGHLEAHETDMVLSNEILAASRTNEKAIFAQLRTSPEGSIPPKRKQDWRRLDRTSSQRKAARASCANCGDGPRIP